MSTFNWLGGSLSSPTSWGPNDPDNPAEPGAGDFIDIAGSGTLAGSVSVAQATLNGTFDLTGSILSSGASILNSGTLTMEAGSAFGGLGLTVLGATVVQLGGAATSDLFSMTIDKGADYQLQGGTLSTGGAEIIGDKGDGSVEQTGGSNTCRLLMLNSGSFELDGGTLSVGPGNEYIGDYAGATGSFTQKGGTHTVTGDFSLGFGGTGTYDLQGGDLTTVKGFIGQNGVGTFTQTGGTHTASDRIVLGIDLSGGTAPGTGTYILGGTGSLKVQTVFIGSDPGCTGTFDFNVKAGDAATLTVTGAGGYPGLIVGGEGTGTFNQGHGDVSSTIAVGFRTTGNGTYNFDAGHLTSTDEKVGATGVGLFIQKGASNKVTGSGLVVGSAATATGTYQLNKGLLDASSETIGDLGKGTLKQASGTNQLSGALVIGNGKTGVGAYELTGDGKLMANGGVTLGKTNGATGTFSLDTANPAAWVTVKGGGLTIGGAGKGTFTQNGSTLTAKISLGAQASGDGIFTLTTGAIVSDLETVGVSGKGAFTQKGGTNTLTTGAGLLTVGSKAGGDGTYELDLGTLTALGESVGGSGKGTFTQKGGLNEVKANDLRVGDASSGDGTYSLHNGALKIDAGGLVVGAQANSTGAFEFNPTAGDAATLEITSGVLTVGDGGTGSFTQGGGTLLANLVVGSQTGSEGTYDLVAGNLTSTDGDEVIGEAGTGTLTQKAGINLIDNGSLYVGDGGGDGTYNLGGKATLTIKGGEFSLGVGGAASGTVNFNTTLGDKAKLTIDTKLITVGVHGTAKFVQGAGTLNAKLVVGGQVGAHGTFELDGGTVSALGQVVGNDGTGTFNQNNGTNRIGGGGDLIMGAFSLGAGIYNLAGGKLTAGGELVGYAGTGDFTQTGGTNTISGVGSLLDLGVLANSQGRYELDKGSLTALQEIVGDASVGTFVQKGGTNTVKGAGQKLDIGAQATGKGSYELDRGTLKAIQVFVGDAGTGSFTQKGGASAIAGTGSKLDIGAQAASHGTYQLDKGTLTTTLEIVGDAGAGVFKQNGGAHTVSATLTVGAQASSSGAYTLTKGTLAAGVEVVGAAAVGRFTQKGGTNTVGSSLTIGKSKGSDGTYTLSGGELTIKTVAGKDNKVTLGVGSGSSGKLTVTNGKLTTPKLVVGTSGVGRVTVGAGGVVNVATTLTIHSGSTLISTAGAVDIGSGVTAEAGTIGIGTGGSLVGSGVVKGAVKEQAGGVVEAKGGVLTLSGAVSGGGTLVIDDAATLRLQGADANRVMFKGAAGTLKLDHPELLTGKITNIQVGDVIDLVGIEVTTASLKSGVLTLTKAGGGTLTLQVAGAFSGNTFVIKSDGHGGSDLLLQPKAAAVASPATVSQQRFIQAAAGFGASPNGPVHPVPEPHFARPPTLAAGQVHGGAYH